MRSRANDDLDTFCRKVVSRWVDIMASYLCAADKGIPVHFVSYERLLEDTAGTLVDMLHWLGVPHNGQMVQRAAANMQFDKLQAMEARLYGTLNPLGGQKRFFRRGGAGSGCAELQESTVREIRQRTAALLKEADCRRMKQSSARPAPVPAAPHPSNVAEPNGNGGAKEALGTPSPQKV